ncbi:MAG: hypothetical protein KJ749_00250 [Planctomycetes bacterium]|nr:hypothetical protein [Planctomycetota bacterium]
MPRSVATVTFAGWTLVRQYSLEPTYIDLDPGAPEPKGCRGFSFCRSRAAWLQPGLKKEVEHMSWCCVLQTLAVGLVASLAAVPAAVRADAFDGYTLMGSFELPRANAIFDCLSDGRIVAIAGDDVYVESAVGSGTFTLLGTLPDADMPTSWPAAFIRVSRDGTKLAVGNNGGGYPWNNFEVGIFAFPTLTGDWFSINHYDAEWYSNTRLAITAAGPGVTSIVTVLRTTSSPAGADNPTVIDNVGGYSAGITFDAAGNLYTGNAFRTNGPSDTGWVKVFGREMWTSALTHGLPLDFETTGILVVDVLSAAYLGFDVEGNLHVGGGDSTGGPDQQDFAALVRAFAVSRALAGEGAADPGNPTEVRSFDPDSAHDNYFVVNSNPATGELYVTEFGSTTVYVYTPEPGDPFAAEVIGYTPAPGQFVNNAAFNDPARALGPPEGYGTYDSNNTTVVTLGGFGGSLTLKFDHVVEDDPLNWFGMDAIVFGNAFWVDEEADRHWAECATIEIALDANHNGQIDEDKGEGWYLIPGSHITDPVAQYTIQTWDDNPGTAIPPELLSWVPPGYYGTWTTSAYLLPDLFDTWIIENPAEDPDDEGIFGYGEYTPTLVLGDLDADNEVDDLFITPEEFYTIPDDPFKVGISPGSGGGDAFDIAWAIDADTGESADLPGFDFIRITNPTNVVSEILGEKSPEIDAVADAAPDPFGNCDGDRDIDLADVAGLQNCFGVFQEEDDACECVDRDDDEVVDLGDFAALGARLTGPR